MLHRKVSLALFSFALISGCRTTNPGDSAIKVMGGVKAEADDALLKSTVRIEGNTDLCTGTLITPYHVLTAAHCTALGEAAEIHFGATTYKAAAPKNVRRVKNWTAHESFAIKPVVINDISIITLEAKAPAGFIPVALAAKDEPLAIGQEVTIAGYGWTGHAPDGLMKANIAITKFSPEEKTMTFRSEGVSGCHGDSGGPAYISLDGTLKVVGATSHGQPDCKGDSVYTDVRLFLNWIQKTIKTFPGNG